MAWKPLTQLRRNARKGKKSSREEKDQRTGPYWRARSLSACDGRAAASTPRPSAACLGPNLPARQESRRPPEPGAQTLVARPPAPGWQDGQLGPPDLQLGNTNMPGNRIKLCNQQLVDRCKCHFLCFNTVIYFLVSIVVHEISPFLFTSTTLKCSWESVLLKVSFFAPTGKYF